jgi:hypothetical protein
VPLAKQTYKSAMLVVMSIHYLSDIIGDVFFSELSVEFPLQPLIYAGMRLNLMFAEVILY